MKLRKLFAGVAAAATLLGGMAFGAATANAAEVVNDNATFTFTAETAEQLTGRDVTAYKIGDYVKYGSGNDVQYGVQTVAGNAEAVKTALEAAEQKNVTPDYLANALAAGFLNESADRPWNEGTTRAFADSLAKATLAGGQPVDLSAATKTTGTGDATYAATVSLPAGIYLFVDNTAATGEITKAVPMVVASGTVKDKVLSNPTAGATVNFKNSKNADKTKTADKTSVSVGDTITYTLTGKVSNPAPASFVFTDKPGKGLTVAKDTKFTVTADNVAVPAADYTVAGLDADLQGDGAKTFTVTLNDPAKYAGKTIVVKYAATVNSEAADQDKVVNGLQGNDGNYKQTPVSLYKFSFNKKDAAGNAVNGAKFTLSVVDGQTGKLPSAGTTATSANGVVTFKGLAAGTYTVTETKAADGYLQSANGKVVFTVTIAKDGSATFAKTVTSDPFGLVTIAKDGTLTVTNVKNITELPKTGAAGIAMFVALGVMLAGAAATVYAKSRRTNAALHA
ncbi:isopeptide-forming domain-containing fimbrial protein [Bifidobacterium callimiconis]|uniref:SpaA isopeptide-forming pilin-related protein n=1 Tax=Bifidobacterium callimiconis TaxID=2306973 RepID=UPI001BDDBB50|nr:isopeptide-forming domain-containing fimbrial protein [Bifidobacterium callimiconis]MBT1177839.1 isopeptide-forming domain-containing fimbrial protein [Bifidobacterium callimiconis]